jgi:hypothetical protein
MSKDAVLDALDAMIAQFDAQPTAAGAANAQSKTEDLRGSQPILGVLGVGRSLQEDTYGKNSPTELTETESIPIDSSRVVLPKINAQRPKRPKSQNAAVVDVPASPNFAQKRAECFWHLDHGERIPRNLCAGCRNPILPGDDSLDLADDNRVHFPHGDDAYNCLIQWGQTWREAARKALAKPAEARNRANPAK